MVDRMTQKEAIQAIKNETKRSFGITTDFGIVDVTKKEAMRMVETCEMSTVVVSIDSTRFILEYPE